ncbi:hypothetical protein M569_04918 [Genlisea aurea]|uniref:U1-type domain-containing protein n=1 Tax=Genlisea aurea TaxID=192259 RepID=S8CXY4_9LAMI|nr:hypothetical protein M569_04918 [Genlisea aurea]
MSRTLVQPVGQKRLTNVAVVRLRKHGNRFEIACYKNKVLSWRSGVEKDLDEVLQSHTVYLNVSKGVLAKSKDLVAAFGTDDQTKICLEILDTGELQVAGKERESQLSNQFRDIATIVMQKTINPDTQRPYTISMIERLMHDIHFAVDPNSSSKKQALEVIRDLQKRYPIRRSPMRLRLTVPKQSISSVLEKIDLWNSTVISRDESESQLTIICELEPSIFRECDGFMRNVQGRLEIVAANVHVESESLEDSYDDRPLPPQKDFIVEGLQKLEVSSAEAGSSQGEGRLLQKCSTCNAFVGDSKDYREHCKSEWHKHNLRRKTRQLPPLTAEECSADLEIGDTGRGDLKDYSF